MIGVTPHCDVNREGHCPECCHRMRKVCCVCEKQIERPPWPWVLRETTRMLEPNNWPSWRGLRLRNWLSGRTGKLTLRVPNTQMVLGTPEPVVWPLHAGSSSEPIHSFTSFTELVSAGWIGVAYKQQDAAQ